MTAETAGKAAIEGVWGTIRTLRDQWLLLVFMMGALVWLRDTYDEFAPLPATVAAQAAEMSALAESVGRLEEAMVRDRQGRQSPVLEFPADRHGVEDGRAGGWTVAHLRSIRPLRTDCRTEAVDAWIIDSKGRWFLAKTSVSLVPQLSGETDLAFGVYLHPDAAPGRAQVLIQFTHDCGTHRQVQTAPRLQFRVTTD